MDLHRRVRSDIAQPIIDLRGDLTGSSYDAKQIRISVHFPPRSRNLDSRFETRIRPSVAGHRRRFSRRLRVSNVRSVRN